MSEPIIHTENLTVYYGKRRGIAEVDLDVVAGEVFGFLGPNGAGKTTTLRVLLDVIRPTIGRATIFGLDTQQNGVAIRQRVGYVPGELAFPEMMKGREYLNMINSVRTTKADAEYRRQLCSRFDLDISRRIRAYSRGNKQKLALVAAFMHQPDLLILDEPTGGLDPLIQQQVIETVREAKNDGRTVFFSSHILPEVQAVCDRVGIIREGKLSAIENVQSLLERQFHRLQLRLMEPIPDGYFDAISGVVLLDSAENLHRFEVHENLPEFMYMVSKLGIEDMVTQGVSLEDVFLTYYGKGANNNA